MAELRHVNNRFWKDSGWGFNREDPDREPEEEEDGSEVWQHFRRALAQPAEAKQMHITEFSLIAWQQEQNGASQFSYRSGEHQVSLLHLLEGLRAWEEG